MNTKNWAVVLTGTTLLVGCQPTRSKAQADSGSSEYRPRMIVSPTEPRFVDKDEAIEIVVPQGSMSLDLTRLIDLDSGTVTEDPGKIRIVLKEVIKSLFLQYDLYGMTPSDVTEGLKEIRISKPVKVEDLNYPFHTWVVLGLKGDSYFGAVRVVERDGQFHASDKQLPNSPDELVPLKEVVPALGKPAAYRAASLFVPGYSAQSVAGSSLKRVNVETAPARVGTIDFLWFDPAHDGYLVRYDGRVFRASSERRLQDLGSATVQKPVKIQEIGRYTGD
ncbi:MAG: hypothetical protein FJZ01_08845 [Candidatus Sericytochromatia bacterium]|nr:hypothetical protein [Candidatus Tanganyikabacteria bacterium]